ncbi:hypothetical protein GYMLUDRAFT_609523 [Collybiopsis luxurians FD-317 M1]|uniref:Unplaced genomic scaffold GYMLUscaffold_27, whole genome shotgun sequence n=1 Tax=Collybiopsis luxurians FD-317 M1 TaxID=944289 RepID=A0A0D0CNV1_9AGAR|nr:hypothetical protein GYMLUDRAFT_609523 [Collybiopsis luxurians FD-317 M1]
MSLTNGNAFQGASQFIIGHATFITVSKDIKEEIQKWLDAPNCNINFRNANDKRTRGTCQWILTHPQYLKWKQGQDILWIQGKAGSGKTILL